MLERSASGADAIRWPHFAVAPRTYSGRSIWARLQAVRVIDIDCFPLGVKIECANSAFAVAVARLLDPAEGKMDLGSDGGCIDVGDPGVKIADGSEGAVYVLVYRAEESPYFMSLAISIPCSSESHGMQETTGPKISSCAMRILGSTSEKTVGSMKYPCA